MYPGASSQLGELAEHLRQFETAVSELQAAGRNQESESEAVASNGNGWSGMQSSPPPINAVLRICDPDATLQDF
jgi:hypothetical protein